ncbi:hypothetical protein BIFGAL_04475 [Bifidobacterium gallicum DSM 20093 = LMG 11596]|uniref:Uncharacterized protein n=1 Tax=Bifidobacterium gallicum DSM 20093 = LMG 11596 TaxID=561180 RepID=D1NX67_9BIFI|nr:hypothetical protein BIFGAL_04475 [Bifidobacterium gallicum DSM 20093 = LMG 11596]
MIPKQKHLRTKTNRAPRKRGDDPARWFEAKHCALCSPQARG